MELFQYFSLPVSDLMKAELDSAGKTRLLEHQRVKLKHFVIKAVKDGRVSAGLETEPSSRHQHVVKYLKTLEQKIHILEKGI